MENDKPLETGSAKDAAQKKKVVRTEAAIQPEVNTSFYQDTIKDLNAKILKITLTIREQYHELSKFLNEMPVTIPNEEKPELEVQSLKNYYESLCDLLNKYRLEHPKID